MEVKAGNVQFILSTSTDIKQEDGMGNRRKIQYLPELSGQYSG